MEMSWEDILLELSHPAYQPSKVLCKRGSMAGGLRCLVCLMTVLFSALSGDCG